jgi:predicted dehydrogenase
MKKIISLLILINTFGLIAGQDAGHKQVVRMGIAGLSHSHVMPLLRTLNSQDFQVVGIYEENREMAMRYARQFKIDSTIIYSSLDEMLDKTKPQGVLTFTSIYDHLKVVKACAPRGIHVMVEKPLAVNTKHADEMINLAKQHKVMLLTNYETSWYPTNHKSFEMIANKEIGDLRKIIVYDGHKGPQEIRVNKEFLAWLADPVGNGGGAVIDFGCYGADLITRIMNGERPQTVYAVLKQYKPAVYPKVDDDATIILSYPSMTGIINASWNWPFNRKDMHIYGSTGYIFNDDSQNMRYKLAERSPETSVKLPLRDTPNNNPFSFFAAAIRGEITVAANDLASPEINRTVVEILEAAIKSSKTGKVIKLKSGK